jgi:hypothetical protein
MARYLFVALTGLVLSTLNGGAEAYIGPGAGISLLGAFWGLVLAVVTAIAAVVWYPLRKLFRSRPGPRRSSTVSLEAQPVRVRTR